MSPPKGVTPLLLLALCGASCTLALASGHRSLQGMPLFPCPPAGFDSVKDFDVAEYISASWYIQEQQPVAYQRPGQLFCVRATYAARDPNNYSKGINVFNQARQGSVTGDIVGVAPGSGSAGIIAFPDDTAPKGDTRASKLRVGPSFFAPFYLPFLKRVLFGPYWVVAVSPDYRWAIVSGGPPRKNNAGQGCQTGTGTALDNVMVNGVGLWLFHREQVAPEADLAEMKQAAISLGFDLSVLVKVPQEDCVY